MPSIRYTRIRVGEKTYDSLLELAWQLQLDELEIRNEHHCDIVDLGDDGWWAPDFTLWDETGKKYWLEVKGGHGERLWKVESAATKHPNCVVLATGAVVSLTTRYGEAYDSYELGWSSLLGQEIPQLAIWDKTIKRRTAVKGSWDYFIHEAPDFCTWGIWQLEHSGEVIESVARQRRR